MKSISYGLRNGHNIGIIMKEMVRRAIILIRNERFVFEAKGKEGYSGKWDDVVSSADEAAQAMYVHLIEENFPGYGVIAEENKLKILPSYADDDIYFIVDPLCGTKAFVRRQSHGIGTMIALVMKSEVVAAYVGDIMTQEIFGFRPGSQKVWRISEYERYERLLIDRGRPLMEQYAVLTKSPYRQLHLIQSLIRPVVNGGLFKSFTMADGSIGITAARLWKGEAGGLILSPRDDMPWDMTPVIGIFKKMGFVFVAVNNEFDVNVLSDMKILKEAVSRDSTLLIIHKSRLNEFIRYIDVMNLE